MSKKNFLDALIGWDTEFQKIETHLFDDPAIKQKEFDSEEDELEYRMTLMMDYFDNNLSTEKFEYIDGEEPVRMVVHVPTAAQWASVNSHLLKSSLSEDDKALAEHKLFEMCVRFPDVEAAQPEFRSHFYRLPDRFMRALAARNPLCVRTYANWIAGKYILSDEEKKQ